MIKSGDPDRGSHPRDHEKPLYTLMVNTTLTLRVPGCTAT